MLYNMSMYDDAPEYYRQQTSDIVYHPEFHFISQVFEECRELDSTFVNWTWKRMAEKTVAEQVKSLGMQQRAKGNEK